MLEPNLFQIFTSRLEEIEMKDFKVFYDEKEDILYIAKEGREEEVVELDDSGELIGVELFNASNLLKDVIKQMERRILAAWSFLTLQSVKNLNERTWI